MHTKYAESLQEEDFRTYPVWEFVNNDDKGETLMRAIEKLPVKALDGLVVGTELKFANGQSIFGVLSNIHSFNPRLTKLFLSVSLFVGKRKFHIARYFDAAYAENGPIALASYLQQPIESIFPIEYDLTTYSLGVSDALKGKYHSEPEERLTIQQLAVLAVPVVPNS